ncbi:hypothetical protein [Niastella sp. OAS944]|uniref:hypothetical protein n=1 Tax=Niastella sp. OAS944 TaxID=2664089 RepID=UPI0034991B1D|nr:hypothetical protein [Chitinophagaceae bacterium OAS944]
MKAEYTEKIEKLLGKLTNSTQTPVDFDGLLNAGLQNLMNLEQLYKDGDIIKAGNNWFDVPRKFDD